MTWCGRTIGETLNQLVLMKDDKRLYDCVNTGVILTQLSLCLFAGRGRISLKKVSPAMALMLTAGYWFGAPHLVATSLWTTGAANYSWPGLLQSAFLLPYGLHYHDESFTLPRSVAALSGLLAGWSNEAGGGMALAMSAAAYIKDSSLPACPLAVECGENVGHVIPQRVSGTSGFQLSLRVRRPLRGCTIKVTQGGREVFSHKMRKAIPAEMIRLEIPAAGLSASGDLMVEAMGLVEDGGDSGAADSADCAPEGR